MKGVHEPEEELLSVEDAEEDIRNFKSVTKEDKMKATREEFQSISDRLISFGGGKIYKGMTLCSIRVSNKTYTGVSLCNLEDEFDGEEGRRIAYKRLQRLMKKELEGK